MGTYTGHLKSYSIWVCSSVDISLTVTMALEEKISTSVHRFTQESRDK